MVVKTISLFFFLYIEININPKVKGSSNCFSASVTQVVSSRDHDKFQGTAFSKEGSHSHYSPLADDLKNVQNASVVLFI